MLLRLPLLVQWCLLAVFGWATAVPAAAIAPSDLLKHGFDALVTFRFPDGAVRTVSARKLLEQAGQQGQQACSWLQGPLATEWLLAGVPEDEQGGELKGSGA